MNQVISSRSTSSTDLVGAGGSLKRSVLTGHRMTVSRVIGALFLCGIPPLRSWQCPGDFRYRRP